MKKVSRDEMLNGKISGVILRLAIPMIFGILSLVTFNLVDTFFIGRLGKEQLAAVSFTFPVVLIINSISLGLGMGTSSVVSRAAGENNYKKVRCVGTDSIILGFIFALITAFLGIKFIDEIFSILGAEEKMLNYISEYMTIWFLGVPFVVIPMVGNNIIRALGDTKVPSIIMTISALINVVLDPLLIFGIGPFPYMGIRGAALATVFARMTSFTVALYVLIKRDKIIKLENLTMRRIINNWRQVLYVGIPNSMIKMTQPISSGIITRLLSTFSIAAVAGYGVGTRLEFFALSFINALSSVMIPFSGQNYGAGKYERIIKGIKFAAKAMILYSVGAYLVLFIFSDFIARIFNESLDVQNYIKLYLLIVPLGYGFQGIFMVITSVLNAINRPIHAAAFTFSQIFIIYIPIALSLSKFFDIKGIFSAVVISYIITSTLLLKYFEKILKNSIIESKNNSAK
jgi:putative MATE family efflux protein